MWSRKLLLSNSYSKNKGEGLSKIKIKKAVNNIIKALYASIRRFPLTIVVSSALVVMLIIMNEQRSSASREFLETLQRVSMIIALGIPLSLCIQLLFEKKRAVKRKHQFLIHIAGIAFLLMYYFFLLKDFEMVSMTRYAAVSIFMCLAFLYIPWFGNKEGYEFYIVKVLESGLITVIYSAVLYVGISAMFFSIDQLFSVAIDSKFYYYTFLIIAGIFSPTQFLSKIPYSDADLSDTKYPKALNILLLYIVIPLILAYMGILYAYFIKIIVTGVWPVGVVSHLVLWYSVITVGVIFFIFPIHEENKLAKKFLFFFPKIILPILGMMFFSIGLRIQQYGVTENRYFVVVLGLWVLGMMLYFSITKKLRNIIIPISLSILVLNAVVGPFSSFSVSKWSQNRRFERVLVQNKMLEGEKIVHADRELSEESKTQISMILDYFDKNHSLKEVKYIPKDFKMKDMNDVFGFPFTYAKEKGAEEYVHYDSYGKRAIIDVKEYDYLIEMENIVRNQGKEQGLQADYDMEKHLFQLKENGILLYEKNLEEFVEKLHEKYGGLPPEDRSSIDPKNMIFVDENEAVKVQFVFRYIGGLQQGDRMEMKDANFYVLIYRK